MYILQNEMGAAKARAAALEQSAREERSAVELIVPATDSPTDVQRQAAHQGERVLPKSVKVWL